MPMIRTSSLHVSATLLKDLPELWVRTERENYLPIHSNPIALGPAQSRALPFIHSLSGCDTTSYPYFIGKKIWLNRSKATYIPALEAFRDPDEGQPCITPEVISQVLIAVYTNKDDDFMGAELGKVKVYKFLNNKSTLLKLLSPTEDALISNICDVQHWQLCWTRLHTLASLTSNHVKIMGGLWMMASLYQCRPHKPAWPQQMTKTISCGCSMG